MSFVFRFSVCLLCFVFSLLALALPRRLFRGNRDDGVLCGFLSLRLSVFAFAPWCCLSVWSGVVLLLCCCVLSVWCLCFVFVWVVWWLFVCLGVGGGVCASSLLLFVALINCPRAVNQLYDDDDD